MKSTLPTRILGSNGLEVSAIGLGCMSLSAMYKKVTESDARAVIYRALDLGITMFDTSDAYGPFTNEELLGRTLGCDRDDVVLATKFGTAIPGVVQAHGDRRSVLKSCDSSLKRLGVDHIDLYYQHRVDFSVPVEETFSALAELVQSGKVRHVGMSEASPDRIRRAHSVQALSAVQTEYSLWSREAEKHVIPTLKELGIGLVAYSPLGRGFLTGSIKSRDDLGAADVRRTRLPRFSAQNIDHNLNLVSRITTIAERRAATTAQVALAWVLAQGEFITTIPGSDRVDYLEQNIAGADLRLTEAECGELNAVFPVGAAAGDRYDPEAASYIDV